MQDLNVIDLIIAKREGQALDADQITALVVAFTSGKVPDYQMSAFLMAAFLRGMNEEETYAMTEAMWRSGITLDLSGIPGVKIGKHSTGGVGDKVSLILGPTVAACGVVVPKLSGRGLGFTGGTLDKLESIPGFRTRLTIDEFKRELTDIGLVMAGQTGDVAPADKALYALRDVTGTVDFIPFIASSIMSKKLAEGTDGLVLDVKCGTGAFMKDESGARSLAEMLVGIGEAFDKPTVAWMTDMNTPLGRAVGNWPEVVEAIEVLQGAVVPDLVEIVCTLGGEMLRLGGKAGTTDEGFDLAHEAIVSGRAFDKFVQVVEYQGGDVEIVRNPQRRESAAIAAEVHARMRGFVTSIDALAIGRTVMSMGAGRVRKEDDVDPLAGLVLTKKPGDRVQAGEPIARLYTRIDSHLESFSEAVSNAFEIGDEAPLPKSILLDRYSDGAWLGAQAAAELRSLQNLRPA